MYVWNSRMMDDEDGAYVLHSLVNEDSDDYDPVGFVQEFTDSFDIWLPSNNLLGQVRFIGESPSLDSAKETVLLVVETNA